MAFDIISLRARLREKSEAMAARAADLAMKMSDLADLDPLPREEDARLKGLARDYQAIDSLLVVQASLALARDAARRVETLCLLQQVTRQPVLTKAVKDEWKQASRMLKFADQGYENALKEGTLYEKLADYSDVSGSTRATLLKIFPSGAAEDARPARIRDRQMAHQDAESMYEAYVVESYDLVHELVAFQNGRMDSIDALWADMADAGLLGNLAHEKARPLAQLIEDVMTGNQRVKKIVANFHSRTAQLFDEAQAPEQRPIPVPYKQIIF